MCPVCVDDEDIEVVRTLEDGRTLVRHRCGVEFEHGSPTPVQQHRVLPIGDVKAKFPRPDDVDPMWVERATRLKAEYLTRKPDVDPAAADYWAKYQQVFSPRGPVEL